LRVVVAAYAVERMRRPDRLSYRESVGQSARGFSAPQIRDVALGVSAAVLLVATSGQLEPGGGERAFDALAYACMAAAGGVLSVRRRWPVTTVAVVTTVLAVYLARGYPGGPVFATLFIALYSVAVGRSRRLAFGSAAFAAGALVVVAEAADTGPGLVVHLVFVGWAAAAVFLGDAVRSRRSHLAALQERARHLEQSREDEARRRVVEERLRIARDLHDSVAHSMVAINVQSGVAAHLIDRYPSKARDALVVIQQASREVLEELTALLVLLRLDPGEEPGRSPTPGLDQLEALVESTGRAGLGVVLHVEPQLGVVPHPVSVAAYRIVQESLTNVVRHAGSTAHACVTVAGNGVGGLSVEVADDGGSEGRRHDGVVQGTGVVAGAGVGITGMRERVEATGGRLEAGPRPGHGFVVRATWPPRS
jgi:signal transduction histidine kinase